MGKIVKLQSCDGELFEIDGDTMGMCTTVKNMLRGKSAFRNSLGGQFSIDGSYVILKKEGRVLASLTKNTDEEAIVTLPDVKAATLEKVLEYCKYHTQSLAPEREKKNWDAEFVQVKQSVLCELASASYYLDIKPLVNLTSRAIATQISGKTSEEIRETFCNINYEVYAPVFASSLQTRCRLQRKFNKKKQEKDDLANRNESKDDQRSVDELLSFIEDNGTGKKKKKPKKKTEPKKKKEKAKPDDAGSTGSISPAPTPDGEVEDGKDDAASSRSSSTSDDEIQDGADNLHSSLSWQLTDEDEDDELDPDTKAALDREVEEFRLRLENMNSQTHNGPKIPLRISSSSLASSLVGVH